MKRIILLGVLALLAVPTAWADVPPTRTKVNNRCNQYRMCDAHTGTTDCGAAVDEIVLHVGQWANYTFSSIQSVGSHSCDIISNLQGHDAASGVGDTVNTTAITDEAPMYTMRVLLRHFWLTCSENATSVTIDVIICPL